MKIDLLVVLSLILVASRAQEGFAPDPMSAAELRTTLEFLASDELLGRDSPSAGLTLARDYLVTRVRAAGLTSGAGDAFLFRYTLPGVRLDASQLRVVVRAADGTTKALVAGDDVRVWRADREFANPDVEVLRVSFEQEGADRLLQRQGGKRPVIVEVETSSAIWAGCAGVREKLASRRARTARSDPGQREGANAPSQAEADRLARGTGGAAPWLLVRKGVLPEGALRADVELPAPEDIEVDLHNVVAVHRVPDAEEWVLFSAHYDHVGIGAPRDGDAIYNGADDDATGSAAVLALAETFAAQKPKLTRNVAFVWFSAEEKGLRGSRAFVENPSIKLTDIAAVVNLEMLGRPPKEGPRHAWITGSDLSDFASIAEPLLRQNEVKLVPFAMAAALFNASDNLPFAQKGVVAHSISAGSLHEDYHQPSDEVRLLDLDHMSAVVRGLYAFGVELATRPERPSYNEKGKKQLRL